MGKIAFVFAGQGAQYPGMGLKLQQASYAAAALFRKADTLRPGSSAQCFQGTEEELRQTKHTQPCTYIVEMAAVAALTEHNIKADMTAGFSVGELAAVTCAGIVDFQTGFRLVCRRGELMQHAAERQSATMAAVLRLSDAEVEGICAQFSGVYPVNYNCPGQISVSAEEGRMEEFSQAVKAAGGRVLPLKVSGGFHSPFMADAAEAFAQELQGVEMVPPSIPVYSNYTGELYSGDERELLAKQISSPVRWERVVRAMIADGADTFLELGPGRTLCGLIGKIDPSVRTFSVSDGVGLEKVIAEVRI